MSEIANDCDTAIRSKARTLLQSLQDMSLIIAGDGLNLFESRLDRNISSIYQNIEEGIRKSNRIEKILHLLKANSIISESKKYISALNVPKVKNKQQLLDQLDEIDSLLFINYFRPVPLNGIGNKV